MADRVRAVAEERELSIRKLSEAIGWHETQLGVILRRLDAGGNVRSDVLEELADGIGKSVHWLLTGEEPEGALIESLPGWADARDEARERFRVSEEALRVVARWRVASPPSRIDAGFVVALARAWEDARTANGRADVEPS
ncbi:MAG TPA: hypothetical protein VLT47_11175 [Anaeromyxobacteraceae bacterium]|nr:hypothetical protein [Anaeromyxobacteraceae bacterium]